MNSSGQSDWTKKNCKAQRTKETRKPAGPRPNMTRTD